MMGVGVGGAVGWEGVEEEEGSGRRVKGRERRIVLGLK
jgi:hypothetical protein